MSVSSLTSGEHQVDDVRQIAAVPWSRLAGDRSLPVADRRADGLEILVGEGDDSTAGFA